MCAPKPLSIYFLFFLYFWGKTRLTPGFSTENKTKHRIKMNACCPCLLWSNSSLCVNTDTRPLRGVSVCVHAESLQPCPSLCDVLTSSPPGSSVHGSLQARILEWVAMPSSGNLAAPGVEPMPHMSPALRRWMDSLPLAPPWKPTWSWWCSLDSRVSSALFKVGPQFS